MMAFKQTASDLWQKVVRRRGAAMVAFGTISLVVVIAALLAGGAPSQASAQAAPQTAPTDRFTCTPVGVSAFTSRVAVRCSAAAPGGIWYFAVSTADSGSASRFLSIFTTAKVTGKNVDIYYTPSDTSGNAWGCNASDCRVIWGAEVVPW